MASAMRVWDKPQLFPRSRRLYGREPEGAALWRAVLELGGRAAAFWCGFSRTILLGAAVILFGMAWLWAVIADRFLVDRAARMAMRGRRPFSRSAGSACRWHWWHADYFHRPVRALYQIGSTRSRTTLCFTARAGRSCGASSRRLRRSRSARIRTCRSNERKTGQAGAEAEAALPLRAFRDRAGRRK